MRKIIILFFSLQLLLTGALVAGANPSASGNISYLYVIPQSDGTIMLYNKLQGDFPEKFSFVLPEEAMILEVVEGGTKIDERTVEVNITKESPQCIYQYKVMDLGGVFEYASLLPNTNLIILIPEGAGSISSADEQILLETEGEAMLIGDKMLVLYTAQIAEANTGYLLKYDPKAPPTSSVPKNNANKAEDVISNVQKKSGQFHSPGHIKLWKESPFGGLNPHIFLGSILILSLFATGLFIYFKIQDKKKGYSGKNTIDEDEFIELVSKRNVILAKVTELEESLELGLIDKDTYIIKEEAYRKKLIEVILLLRRFTD